jgi:hypothetical protein
MQRRDRICQKLFAHHFCNKKNEYNFKNLVFFIASKKACKANNQILRENLENRERRKIVHCDCNLLFSLAMKK